MAATMLLDRSAWDLTLDASGNMALATEPYSQVQDVASAARCFYGECYYATIKGVRYFQQILGHEQPIAILKAQLATAAMTVPGVVSAVALLSGIADRVVTGQIQSVLESGDTVVTAL